MRKHKLLFTFVVVIAFVLLSAGAAFAAETPNYTFEVKFLLDSTKVLGSDNVPLKDLQDLFAVKKTNQRVVLYIDSSDRTFNNGGWINRVREKEGKKNIAKGHYHHITWNGKRLRHYQIAVNDLKKGGELVFHY